MTMSKHGSTMTAQQFRGALKRLGLSIYAGGPALGLSLRQAQRIAAGSPVPRPVAKLLRLAEQQGITAEQLAAL